MATTSQTLFFAPEIVDENESSSDSNESVFDAEFDLDFDEPASPSKDDCGCSGSSGQSAVDSDDAETDSFTEAPLQQVKVPLFKMKNWPEFKVDMERKCKWILRKKFCVNVPHAFMRKCEMVAFAEVSHPTAEAIKADIIDCVRKAVAAGTVAGVLTGNVAAAIAALKVALTTCLAAKGKSQLSQLRVNIRTETACGDWKPR